MIRRFNYDLDSESVKKRIKCIKSNSESIQQPTHEPIHTDSESIQRESFLKEELRRKDEIINKLIDHQASSEEKLQTIIMKLTQDLEKIRSENQLLLETAKNKKRPKEKQNKKDRVVSIEEYINKKIEEDIEKSNYEKEKKRLKNKYSNPLQGKSKLYQLYIKLFHPEKLRREA